jgi:hypothetical protein
MKSTSQIAMSPLLLKREDLGDGNHKYSICIYDRTLDIRFKDSPLSDDLFAGWFPFLALRCDKENQVRLYQVEASGGLVEWMLENVGEALHYSHHRFVNTVTFTEMPASGYPRHNRSLLSLDIASLKSIRDLAQQGFIINQEILLAAVLRPSRLLICDSQGLVRYTDERQVSPPLATQIEESVGPIIYDTLAGSPERSSSNETMAIPEEAFLTCIQRWESKNQLIQALCLPQPNLEGDLSLNHYRYTHYFSYTPENLDWVCHCVGVRCRALSTTLTVYLLESGEVGLISGAYIPSLDTLIISPHSKNGLIDHSVLVSRFSEAISHYCGTSIFPADPEESKHPTCMLLALTNDGNLYHLMVNDLYGIFSCTYALNKEGLETYINLGKGHSLLPFSIPATYFNGLCKAQYGGPGYEEDRSTEQSFNKLSGPMASGNILTLAKSPYWLGTGPLAHYKQVIAKASKCSQGINQIDLHSCSLTSAPTSFFEKEIDFIVFGIRCARRKPVNQLELFEAMVRIADSLNRDICIVIEGTYSMTGSLSESAFIAEECGFVDKARELLNGIRSLTQVFSFVGKSSLYSTCSAFLDATVIAPWGAGLARHMFSAEKRYIIHTNASNHASMTSAYYSWEVPYRPKHISYLSNKGEDINCAANEEVKRLDPSRPDWSIFNDYAVNIEHFSETLRQILGCDSKSRIC